MQGQWHLFAIRKRKKANLVPFSFEVNDLVSGQIVIVD